MNHNPLIVAEIFHDLGVLKVGANPFEIFPAFEILPKRLKTWLHDITSTYDLIKLWFGLVMSLHRMTGVSSFFS